MLAPVLHQPWQLQVPLLCLSLCKTTAGMIGMFLSFLVLLLLLQMLLLVLRLVMLDMLMFVVLLL